MYLLAFVARDGVRARASIGEASAHARAYRLIARTHAYNLDAEDVVVVKLRYFSFSLQLQTFSLDFAWWVDDSSYSNGIRSTKH